MKFSARPVPVPAAGRPARGVPLVKPEERRWCLVCQQLTPSERLYLTAAGVIKMKTTGAEPFPDSPQSPDSARVTTTRYAPLLVSRI